jgi:hypothetical protein
MAMRSLSRLRAAQAALFALGAAALLVDAARRRGRLGKNAELFSSACALAAALLAWRRDAAGGAEVTRPLAVGMACGLAGDLVMGRRLPLPERVYVPVGMLTFGAGHLAYLAAFRALALRAGLRRRAPLLGAVGAALLLGALCWQLWVRNDERAALSYAALLYAALLSSMAGAGAGLALQNTRLALLAVGGALFMASDLLLGARLLREASFPGRDELIWLSYTAAQNAIIWAASAD